MRPIQTTRRARRPAPLAEAALIAALLCLVSCAAGVLHATLRIMPEYVEVAIAGLPAALDGFRIVQVTDLHGRRLDPAGPVAAIAAEARPDIIVATGDFVRKRAIEMDGVIPLLRALAEVAPLYAVSGNHDHWAGWNEVSAVLRDCGAIVLDNDHVVFERNGARLVLAGVGDPVTGHDDLSAALPPPPGGDGGTPGTAPVVLLVHSPWWWETAKYGGPTSLPETPPEAPEADAVHLARTHRELARVALALAGHTHGGQIRLPFIGALSNASGRFMPRDYVAGLSREGQTWLYISRGLGFSILPFRFLAPAEVTVITLRAG